MRHTDALVAANDSMRAAIDDLVRRNRPVPPQLRIDAEALEAELLEARYDNMPV